jgi:histidinol-phosphate aminotransferase
LKSVPRRADQLWLDKNENVDPALMVVVRAVLRETPPLALATYPEAGELYRKLAAWCGLAPEQLLLTPGSDGAIRVAFEAFVEHGDPVVHTSPTFAMYPVYSQMFGARVERVEYHRTDDGPRLDADTLMKAVRDRRPKLVCLPNPDSPTGTALESDALAELLRVCESAGAVLLVDEAYHPFHDFTVADWTSRSKNLVIARTFAKAWGAAGLRIGYAIAHPETAALLHKMRPMYEVSTVAVEFMSRMLDRAGEMSASVARILDGKAYFVGEMRALGFSVLPTAGNFVHVAFGGRGSAVHAALAGQVLYRAAFSEACLAGYSRFTVAPRPIMARVVELIKESVQGGA